MGSATRQEWGLPIALALGGTLLYQVVQLVLTLAHADWSGFRQGISVCCWGHPLLLASLVYSHVSTLQGTPSLGPQAQHQISLGQPC